MGAMGEAPKHFPSRSRAAVRPDLYSTLPRRRLRKFLVLDFFLRAPVCQHGSLGCGMGTPEGQLLLHPEFHNALAVDTRASRHLRIRLGRDGSLQSLVRFGAAGVFFRSRVSRALFPAALFHSSDARG